MIQTVVKQQFGWRRKFRFLKLGKIELKIPNAKTARAIKEARKGKGVTVCKDANDLIKKLEE